MLKRKQYATAEALAYAKILQVGMRASLILLAVSFVAYMLDVFSPTIPASEMSRYWGMSAPAYLEQRGIAHQTWPWLAQIFQGDLVFGAIALMAAVTVYCYASFLRFPLASRDKVMITVVASEIVVLSLAASGLLAIGH
ncbi:MAG: hypothetical protein Q7R40_00670 [Phaeospirillum sp.]|nr:hypothetical protein [Phaeospirillum sp.]